MPATQRPRTPPDFSNHTPKPRRNRMRKRPPNAFTRWVDGILGTPAEPGGPLRDRLDVANMLGCSLTVLREIYTQRRPPSASSKIKIEKVTNGAVSIESWEPQ